jgi:hypothetical protein
MLLLKYQLADDMSIFDPSIYTAAFPYLFIASFPVFGIILVTKWIIDDIRNKKREFQLRNKAHIN